MILRNSIATILAAISMVAVTATSPGAATGDCAQPLSTGSGPNTSDCGYILRAAVGSKPCELCVCDVNNSGTKTTSDALICLKKAVGQAVTLQCPSCDGVTTTTTDPGNTPSTTSTSTTSTTTTLPVRCTTNNECSGLPSEFRCNPHTETCEKPCTKTTDCKDFYVCNTTTGYCQEPALQF